MKYYEIKRFARKLRNNQTPSEKMLWPFLRNRQLEGRRFLRQHPIIYESRNNNHKFYIPDFYCKKESLIIELDGKVHESQKERDKRRDLILASRGLRILRIKNEELINIGEVLEKINMEFRFSPPPCQQGGGRGVGNKNA
jgi:very-short-patch-repair endonuclease